ncbi:hypothetical protein LBMAG49_07990 [Planctomycetota bacterium]|nr:hypothetical protein LBMAG49_07990 [Planctomycetota bacterium]
MASHLVLLALLQQFVVTPYTAEVGEHVQVEVRSRDTREPARGLPIDVVIGTSPPQRLGVTDEHGMVGFIADLPGDRYFVTELDGVRLVLPMRIVSSRRRLLYAVTCVPLGLAFGFAIVRRWRRRPSEPAE